MATSLEDLLLNICEMRISELRAELQTTPVVRLVESGFGFNIVQTKGQFVGCRQSLGDIDFTVAPEILSQGYSVGDFFVEDSREKVLIRICEIEKARVNRLIAERLDVASTTEKRSTPNANLQDPQEEVSGTGSN